MGNTFIVTGAAGFIAAKVCEQLLASGNDVIGLDDLNPRYDPRLKLMRLDELTANPRYTFCQLDVTNWTSMVASLSRELDRRQVPVGAIFHLAARAGVRESIDEPDSYFECNVSGTVNVLKFCRLFAIPKLVLASSSSVYGDQGAGPCREDSRTDRPLSPYAASKKAAEVLAHAFHHSDRIDVSVLRYFTVYGPGGRPDMAIAKFIRQLDRDEPIEIFGDGRQSRDFTFVDDIAAGTIAASKMVGFEEFNLGHGHSTEVNEIVYKLAIHLNRIPKIIYREHHPADVSYTCACIDKAQQWLHWSPTVSLDDGLQRTVVWYQHHYEELSTKLKS